MSRFKAIWLDLDWAVSGRRPMSDLNCETRDIFQSRLDRFYKDLVKLRVRNSELLVAISGEIGNNSFDHNLGHWLDLPGCRFNWGQLNGKIWVTLGDRGRGILGSLSRVVPELNDSQQALDIAFHRQVSGTFTLILWGKNGH